MYEFWDPGRSIMILCLGSSGVFMIHLLYKTPRKNWQVILAWGVTGLICALGYMCAVQVFCWVPRDYLALLISFAGIGTYLYLFPEIPKVQCVFTYFMILNLIILLAKMLAILTVVFACVSLPWLEIYRLECQLLVLGWDALFCFFLRDRIIRELKGFRKRLTILCLYAFAGYIVLMIFAEPWNTQELIGIRQALRWLCVMGYVTIGYILTFRILSIVCGQTKIEQENQNLVEQLVLSERYYNNLEEKIRETRAYNHDMKYHVEALQGLCTCQDWNGVAKYVSEMKSELPGRMPKQYCQVGAVNAILEYYENLCKKEGIDFRCQVYIPQTTLVQPMYLCIIYGNGLQNAFEAVNAGGKDSQRYIVLKTASAEGKIAITIQNPCLTEPVVDEKGGYQTTKRTPGHGFGLGNIRDAVGCCNGWCGTSWLEGIFTLKVMLLDKNI
jgi:hypothetical protein